MTTQHSDNANKLDNITGSPPPAIAELTVCKVSPCEECDTTQLFDPSAPHESWSPIDEFIRTTKLLNVLLASRVLPTRASPQAETSIQSTSEMPLAAENEIDEALMAIDDDDDRVDEVANDPASTLTVSGTQLSNDASPSAAIASTSEKGISVLNDERITETAPAMDDQSPVETIKRNAADVQALSLNEPNQTRRIIPTSEEVDAQLNNLVLLGFISAVESYLRSLTTRLVWIDPHVEKKVEEMKLSYGVARHHHSLELLAEAFLEDMTFISKSKIEDLFRQILGLDKISERVQAMLREYERICQLRHCIVHRFGKLGSKNAINLGLKQHRELLEKPIQINASQLQDMAFSLFMTVKTINNFVYDGVLRRQAKLSTDWTWDFTNDASHFQQIYDVFATHLDSEKSAPLATSYAKFKAACEATSATVVEARKLEKQRLAERRSVDRAF